MNYLEDKKWKWKLCEQQVRPQTVSLAGTRRKTAITKWVLKAPQKVELSVCYVLYSFEFYPVNRYRYFWYESTLAKYNSYVDFLSIQEFDVVKFDFVKFDIVKFFIIIKNLPKPPVLL